MKSLLKKFNNLLKGKIEHKKLIVTQRGHLLKQMESDVAEYNLIQQKKSDLPRKQRDLVLARIDAYIALEYIEIQKEDDHE